MTPFISFIGLIAIGMGGVVVVKFLDQRSRDSDRKTYVLMFPSDLDSERVQAWLRSISGTLKSGSPRFLGVPTICFELWASDEGIKHRLKVPWQQADYIIGQLRSLAPGIRIAPEEDYPSYRWTKAVEVGLTNTTRTLRIFNDADLSASLLASVSALKKNEVVIMQWVVTPAVPQHKPVNKVSKSNEVQYRSILRGNLASRDEIDERRKKLDEPNMLAVLRIAAKAETDERAAHLIYRPKAALASVRTSASRFVHRMVPAKTLNSRIANASSVATFPIQLSISELAALIAWPIGNPFISGMKLSLSRQLPPAQEVPRSGRILGMSNFAGHERPVAIGYKEALMHTHVLGATGVGKTTLLANMLKQDMENGYGAILIEAKGDLFNLALNYVPPNRINDVIVLDVNDVNSPVGFNVLRQGDPAVVVDELNMIFDQLFRDNPSLWMKEVMYHGLHTLAESEDATFTDLPALVMPDDTELAWRDRMIRNVKDPQLRQFWRRFDSQPKARQDQIIQPLLSRVWPMSRSKLLNIVGQSTSSFQMSDVIAQNKILLVNLSGIEREAASLMGTLIMNATWNAVKRTQSSKPNFLYLDEAHHYVNLPIDLDNMLVEARSMGLGLVMAHQYMSQFPPEPRDAVMNSARTKIVFQSGDDDARALARSLGGSVTAQDLLNLSAYDAMARIVTPAGMAAPLSMSTLPPDHSYNTASQVLRTSRMNYGRDVAQVRAETIERRQSTQSSSDHRRPRISGQ
jgi:hypothetical protein